jgi:NAD(P)-dependent dehydrogenase (short-subunit alcohol dehydrogenase family)
VRALLITGGTGDLGHAVVRALAAHYRCIVLYREEKAWQELHKSIRGDNITGVKDASQVNVPIYGVLHIAGAFAMGGSIDDFQRMLDAALLSAVRAIHTVEPRIVDGGRIIAISASATLTKPPGMAAYVTAKSALNAYIEVLAKELRPRKITVNALLPSALDTPGGRKSTPRDLLLPLERVTDTIAFLLGDAAASITGQLIALTM